MGSGGHFIGQELVNLKCCIMDTYLVLEYWPFVMRDLVDSSTVRMHS